MTKTEVFGQVQNGALKFLDAVRDRMREDLRHFKDCDVKVIIKKLGKRSYQQNAYYWGCVIKEIQIRLRELGNDFDADDIHEYLKLKFNYEKVEIETTGEVIEIGKTTTELNKFEFSEYVEKVRRWAFDTLDISIPDPGQQSEMFTYNHKS